MTARQLSALLKNFPAEYTLIETHISWVLLTESFAYKIKKPVQFSFLDFSTLEKRRYFCERERSLNQRLTSGIYLEVLPIWTLNDEQVQIGAKPPAQATIIDYALKMKRLDNNHQMHRLLRQGQVEPEQIKQLATQLAAFHLRAEPVYETFDVSALDEKFADILSVASFLSENGLPNATQHLTEMVRVASRFLQQHAAHFQARSAQGFVIDGHGDLHSGNIFLLEEPVIFDCIEFNDAFRQVDMLDEIAFLCLDFDYYQQPGLAVHFLKTYLAQVPCMQAPTDQQVFQFYKLYRANVRLKVLALQAMQENPKLLTKARPYYALMQEYARTIA
ncbi:MAG TPA: hypothetical protein PKC76_02930 [Saprospiraceae bacterium]|nr:hypothetical protein [Saprospiraceae bacterium]HMP23056.1 hypothetical protein [Saprospiraceae bacterium]